MAKKRKLIPFGWSPAHWGLAGKTRELAQAEYELAGEELERKKLEINIAERTEEELKVESLRLDLKHKYITQEEFDRQKIELTVDDDKKRKISMLYIDKKYGHISDAEYEKKRKTLEDEPYIRVAEIKTDPADPAFGGIILDWNKAFVAHLEDNGYGPNPTDEETVNEWFNELCKNVALEAFDGLGDLSERIGTQRGRRNISEDVILRGKEDKD